MNDVIFRATADALEQAIGHLESLSREVDAAAWLDDDFYGAPPLPGFRAALKAAKDALPAECDRCASGGWVCENHDNTPWSGTSSRGDACDCGAGAPCPDCNPRAVVSEAMVDVACTAWMRSLGIELQGHNNIRTEAMRVALEAAFATLQADAQARQAGKTDDGSERRETGL